MISQCMLQYNIRNIDLCDTWEARPRLKHFKKSWFPNDAWWKIKSIKCQNEHPKTLRKKSIQVVQLWT
jgi:hypothetical protein